MKKLSKNQFFLKKWSASLILIVFFLFVSLFLFTDKAYADSVAIVLKGADTAGLGIKIKGIWQILINLCNGLIVLVLIAVAFAQILRLNINTYGVKKVLPTLVLAIIAANFSLLFCRLLVDFSSVISDLFIHGSGSGGSTNDKVLGAFTTISKNMTIPKTYTFGALLWYGLANLMILAAAVILLILAYLFIVRSWMIYFLVSVAPLAFMSLVLPQTKSLFNQWWTNFSKWVFMPIVSLFWIWLAAQWYTNLQSTGALICFIFVGVCYYLAITTPFKMGGAVMSAWGNFGKKTAKLGYNQWGGAASRMSLIGQNIEARNPRGWKNFVGKKLGQAGGVMNVPASVAAYKKGRQGFIENLSTASMKTGTYQRFGGEAGRIEGMRKKNEEDLKFMGTGETARRINPYEDALVNAANTNEKGVAGTDISKTLKNKGLDFATATVHQKRAAARQILAATGVKKILLKYRGLGGQFKDEDDAVMAEGIAKNFIQFERGNKTNTDLKTAYIALGRNFASSAVGTPSGNGQTQVQTGQQGAASVVGTAAAQQLAGAAANGWTYDEAVEAGDGALKVEIERFNPEAQDVLRKSYGLMQAGNRQQESEEFLGEAGERSDKTATIASMIGKDGAEKLSGLANHSNMSFDDALKSSGIDINGLDDGAKKVVQDTYEQLQKSKNQMAEETLLTSQNEIEEELQGIKMVIDGSNHRGVRFGRMKSELEKSQQMYKSGDIAGARSVIEGVSGSLGVSGDANIEKALQKRMEHLNQGVNHFDNFYKSFGNIEDPAARRSAINSTQQMLQVNPASYINDIREKKTAEAKIGAEAATATHLAASNLVANPRIQSLPVTQMATNPIVMQELTNAISGLHQSLDAHGEQISHMATQSSSGGALNQVTKLDPISMGAKSMMVNSLNESIQRGIIGAQTTVAQAFSNKEFRNSIAEGMKKALRETKRAAASPSPAIARPPIQTMPPPPRPNV